MALGVIEDKIKGAEFVVVLYFAKAYGIILNLLMKGKLIDSIDSYFANQLRIFLLTVKAQVTGGI